MRVPLQTASLYLVVQPFQRRVIQKGRENAPSLSFSRSSLFDGWFVPAGHDNFAERGLK